MIARIIKTIAIGAVAYYAAHRATTQAKLLAIRAETKVQIAAVEDLLRHIHARTGEYASITNDEAGKLFTIHFAEYKRLQKIYNKTF